MDSIMKIFLSCLLGAFTVSRFNERCVVLVTASKSDDSNFAMDQYESILQDVTRNEKSDLTASENLDVPMKFLMETDNHELLLQSKAIIDDSPLSDDIDLSSKLSATFESAIFQSAEKVDDSRTKSKSGEFESVDIGEFDKIYPSDGEKVETGLPKDLNWQVDAFGEKGGTVDAECTNETDSVSQGEGDETKKAESSQAEGMPSFSEWTRKRLAEKAEKRKANENVTAERFTKSRGKFRNKNYASPDCGAKIVAANPESVSSSAILSPLKDEYMLNYCTNRIWFIVELCEAIQAKQLDLANFELFSSSPRDFAVSVSHRFPTRDWSGVGKFTARDSRDVQTFDLDRPHLFGKFVKVEFHSHYGKEQFCPISWVGIYGTSEFEVLAKEDERNPLPGDDGDADGDGVGDDDDDDESSDDSYDGEESFRGRKKDSPRNLFSSATDAVLSIVKKATAPFMKTEINETEGKSVGAAETTDFQDGGCFSPRYIIVCNNCSRDCYDSVFGLLSCHWSTLEAYLKSTFVHRILVRGEICIGFGLDFADLREPGSFPVSEEGAVYLAAMSKKHLFPALCNVLAVTQNRVVANATVEGIQTLKNLTRKKDFCDETNGKNERNDVSGSSGRVPCNAGDSCGRSPHSSPPYFPPSTDPIESSADSSSSDSSGELIPSEHYTNKIDPTKTMTGDEVKILSPSHVGVADGGGFGNEPEEKSPDPIHGGQVNPTATVDAGKEAEETNCEAGRKEEEKSEAKPEMEKDSPEGESNNGTNQENATLESIIRDLNEVGKAVDSPSASFASSSSSSQSSSSTNLPADSIFLRLANRIKNLEINMSLSSTYLEELSRRYRVQLDVLSKSLNLTIQKIEERSKSDEEKERRRENEILLMRMQLANLTRDVKAFARERNSWKSPASLVSQHLLFVSVEIFLVWLVFNYWKRPAETNFGVAEAAKKAGRKWKRRSSFDVKGNREPCGGKARRHSDEGLNAALSRSYLEEPFKLEKKRKRRKKESRCSLNGVVRSDRKQTEFEAFETCAGESFAFEKSVSGFDSVVTKSEVASDDTSSKKNFQFSAAPSTASASGPKSSAGESISSESVAAKTFQGIAAPIFIKTALAARNSRTRKSLENQSSQEINFDRRDSKRESEKEKKGSNSLKKYMRKFF